MTNRLFLNDLIESIRFVYNNSNEYFASTNGRERSIVFRIAHHLASEIENKKDFKYKNTFVDIEPTRCENNVKKMINPKTDKKEKPIIPDLVIHKRFDVGYLVVEFKCTKRNWNNDFDKLMCLTTSKELRVSKLSTPYYKLGAFVYLTNKLEDIKIKIFQNGRENEKLTEEYQSKFK